MTSVHWPDPWEIIGVSQDCQLSEILYKYRTRLRDLERLGGPILDAQMQEESERLKEAYEYIVKYNELRHSLESLRDDELQRYREFCDKWEKAEKPTLVQENQRVQTFLEAQEALVHEKRVRDYSHWTQLADLLDLVQPGRCSGLDLFARLFIELSALTLKMMKRTRVLKSYEEHKRYEERKNYEERSYISIYDDGTKGALSGGATEEESQQVSVALPLILAGQTIMALPDTGSDRNVMSADMAKQLGLSLTEDSSHEIFKLANGRVILCKGRVTTHFAFPSEKTPDIPIEFHVLEPLAASVIIGRAFLDATKTLTTHLNRLVRTPQPFGVSFSPPRILHLNPPRRTFQCFINSTAVQANADTGAEMNLTSPGFAARSGCRIEPLDQQYQFVQLADGSIVPLSGCFRARFNPCEKPSAETLRPRAHMKTFYILDGLTSDVLLGRHLLFEIHAFIQQRNSFLEIECPDLYVDLQLIAWLKRWRIRSSSKTVEPTSLDNRNDTFWSKVDVDDAREWRLHQQMKDKASRIMTQSEREVAEEEEGQRHERYNQRRQQRIQKHEDEMALLGWNG